MSTMSTPTTYGSQEDDLDLTALFHQLWGHKWILLLTTVIGLTAGILYALKQPAEYQSNMLIQIDNKQGGAQQVGVAQQMMLGASSGDLVGTQIALIQSRFILEPVVEALGLNVNVTQQPASMLARFLPGPHKQELDVLNFKIPISEINKPFQLVFEKTDDIALYDANKQLILSGPMGKQLTDKTGHFSLEVGNESFPVNTKFTVTKRPSAVVSAVLANTLKVDETGGKNRMGGTGVLELSLKGRNKTEIPLILNTISETASLKNAHKKAEEASQTLSFLNQQLPVTKQLLEEAERSLNFYRAKSGKIDIKIQTEFLLHQLSDLDKQLSELQIKEIEMRQRYKKTHPLSIALDAQVKALKAQRFELEGALKKLPASDQIAVNLMRDVEVKQTLYMLLLNKIQELEVVKAGTVSEVRILSHATLPNAPLPSKKRIFVLGSAMFGFVVGVVYVLGRRLLSPRVDDPHWSERHLNLPNVAIVPFCKEQVEKELVLGKAQPLLAYMHPKNLAVEALRSLRTNLQVTLACASNNVIGILGISPGVGKTFVSSNLGYLLAMAGKRVLLIDTDLRKGTLHNYFNLKSSPGLSEVLTKDITLEAARNDSMHPNLTVITRGAYPKNPAELLTSERFKTLIAACSEQYDVVLFDTPPVLLVTDAVLVGAFAATNFLVCGASAHQPSDIELVLKRLQNAGVVVNGSIFNFHKEQSKNYYYGKYYNYNYYYHDEAEKV